MRVGALTHGLAAEGIGHILVLTDAPDKYEGGASLARGVRVMHRDRLEEAQLMLREIPGVTVLIYDQRCAAESRRLRRRGRLPDPALPIIINTAGSEGWGGRWG